MGRFPRELFRGMGTTLLLLLAALPAARGEEGPGARPAKEYPVAAVTAGEWQPHRQAQGLVRAWRKESLAAPFPLYVKAVPVEQGQQVKEGDTLAEVDAPGLAGLLEGLAQAQREVSLGEEHLQDSERRLADRLATRDEVVGARAELSRARAGLSTARAAAEEALLALGHPPSLRALAAEGQGVQPAPAPLTRARVRAPFDGRIAERNAAAGMGVGKGALLFRLEDTSRVYASVEVPQGDVAVWQGGTAVLSLPLGETLPLRLATPSPSLDRSTGLAVLVYLGANPPGRLLDGQWVTVTLRGRPRPAIWVPKAAVVARRGTTYCVVEREGAYAPVQVTVGGPENGKVPVLSGLQAGQRVVTEGAYELLYSDLKNIMKATD